MAQMCKKLMILVASYNLPLICPPSSVGRAQGSNTMILEHTVGACACPGAAKMDICSKPEDFRLPPPAVLTDPVPEFSPVPRIFFATRTHR